MSDARELTGAELEHAQRSFAACLQRLLRIAQHLMKGCAPERVLKEWRQALPGNLWIGWRLCVLRGKDPSRFLWAFCREHVRNLKRRPRAARGVTGRDVLAYATRVDDDKEIDLANYASPNHRANWDVSDEVALKLDLQALLEKLPLKTARALVLRINGYRPYQIARELGVKEGTALYHLARAGMAIIKWQRGAQAGACGQLAASREDGAKD